MAAFEPPAHLKTAAMLLNDYLARMPDRPFLARGEYGCGRGYLIERILHEHALTPIWEYSLEPVPPSDLDGNALFPVYDLPKLKKPPTIPSIILVPREFDRPDDLKESEEVSFPPPPDWAIEEFLTSRGYPKELARGNPTYLAAKNAALAFDCSGVFTYRERLRATSWAEFKAGDEPPVDGKLLAHYAAEALPPKEWWWNRNLWMQRRIPAVFADLAMDQIREAWPAKDPPFPAILKAAKKLKEARSRIAERGAAPIPSEPARPRGYSIVW